MPAAPIVTVLMPAYRAQDTIAAAVESVLASELDGLELLVVDDGSNDDTVDVLASIDDPRLRVHRLPTNQGITAALNAGLSMTEARYVARTDADDVCLPGRFETQVAYMEAHPNLVAAGASMRMVRPDGSVSGHARYHLNPIDVAAGIWFANQLSHPTVIFDREKLAATGLTYSPVHFRCEDWGMWWRLTRDHTVGNMADVVLDYDTGPDRETPKLMADPVTHLRPMVADVFEFYGIRAIPNEVSNWTSLIAGRDTNPNLTRATGVKISRVLSPFVRHAFERELGRRLAAG